MFRERFNYILCQLTSQLINEKGESSLPNPSHYEIFGSDLSVARNVVNINSTLALIVHTTHFIGSWVGHFRTAPR